MAPSWEGRPRRPILVAAESPGPEVGPAAGGPEARTRPGAEGGAGELTASRRVAPRRAARPRVSGPSHEGGTAGRAAGWGAPGGPGQRSTAEAARFGSAGEPRLPRGGPPAPRPRPAPRPAAQQLPPAHTRARLRVQAHVCMRAQALEGWGAGGRPVPAHLRGTCTGRGADWGPTSSPGDRPAGPLGSVPGKLVGSALPPDEGSRGGARGRRGPEPTGPRGFSGLTLTSRKARPALPVHEKSRGVRGQNVLCVCG